MTDDDLERFTLSFGAFGDDPFIAPIEGEKTLLLWNGGRTRRRRYSQKTGTPTGAFKKHRRLEHVFTE
jgi:hypothetical protein